MKIKNVFYFGEDGQFHEGERFVRDGLFAETAGDEETVDGQGAYMIPGLTDLHFHGCVGYDFCDGTREAVEAMARYEASQGITQICPATMTLPEEVLARVAETAGEYRKEQGVLENGRCQKLADDFRKDTGGQAVLCGINMEGPFVSAKKKGAQNADYLRRPDTLMYRRLQEASGGMIRLVALAPEEPGAMEFIEDVKGETIVSVAHTDADYETAAEAFRRGASHVTHLFNAMPPFGHREPGVVGAAFDAEGCMPELICDGVHIAPSMVRASFSLFGKERLILISDSMMAAGMPDGSYMLGGQAVEVKGKRALLKDGTIAGSATNLMDCLRQAVQMGIPLETAVWCAAVNPARCIGIDGWCGSLGVGKMANFVLLNRENLQAEGVWIAGKRISEEF